MTTLQFLGEWMLRSSILIVAGALLLQALRVKDSALRLAAWVALLCGSLFIPVLMTALPQLPLILPQPPVAAAAISVVDSFPLPAGVQPAPALPVRRPFDWTTAAIALYAAVAATLLLRLCVGLAIGRRLVRASRATGRLRGACEIRESECVAAPVTMGIVRPVIILPCDWREWDESKLDAVLAHENAHIDRADPAVQLLSALHRALLWPSPLSWFLHRQIVRVAEEASDDAAVAATRDRASYAEALLDFMRRGVRGANWQGVAMARYGRPDQRIHRILDGAGFSRGVSRWGVVAILALASPLAYVVAAAHPQRAPQPPAPPEAPVAAHSAAFDEPPVPPAPPQTPAAPAPPAPTVRRYIIINNNSTSGSWDSTDHTGIDALRAKFGGHFAWFRQNGNEYVITDPGVLAEFQKAGEPQKAVNRMQSEVNALQAGVNAHQQRVNQQQDEVNRLQQQVNRRQEILNRIQAARGKDELIQQLEAALRDLRALPDSQTAANSMQTKVNSMQSEVNLEQNRVNDRQHQVNGEQHRVSEQYNRQIQQIFNSAISRHLVQQLM